MQIVTTQLYVACLLALVCLPIDEYVIDVQKGPWPVAIGRVAGSWVVGWQFRMYARLLYIGTAL